MAALLLTLSTVLPLLSAVLLLTSATGHEEPMADPPATASSNRTDRPSASASRAFSAARSTVQAIRSR